MTARHLLELNNLKVQFESKGGIVRSVDDISFHVDKGEIVAIVGESGSGKSVTSLSIMGLVGSPGRVVGGEILFNGRNLLDLDRKAMRNIRGNEISMIFQEPMTSFNPVYSIGAQIAEAIEAHQHTSRREAMARAVEMLRKVEIPDPEERINYYPHQMSGGQRQRAMIAMALACKPDLLIADEPTSALDVIIQAQIVRLLRKLQRDTGISMIFITHDLGVVAEIADRVVVMRKGKIVETAEVHELFAAPKHPYTQDLLAAVPRIDPNKMRSPHVAARAETLVSARNLCKWFPQRESLFHLKKSHVRAVDDVSFDIYRGEVLGLVGESGSGKTTTGRAVLRLIQPTSGQISFDGEDITTLPAHKLRRFRRKMQIIFQDPYASLDPRRTIGEIIAEPLIVHDLIKGKAERNARVAKLLELVHIDPARANRYPREFSGGQRQRIGIARAIAVEPDFIVADECVSALDVSIRREILTLLKDLQSKLKLTMLFISHDLAVIEDISDRVGVMRKGHLIEISDAYNLYRSPQQSYTQALLAAVPIPDPTARRQLA